MFFYIVSTVALGPVPFPFARNCRGPGAPSSARAALVTFASRAFHHHDPSGSHQRAGWGCSPWSPRPTRAPPKAGSACPASPEYDQHSSARQAGSPGWRRRGASGFALNPSLRAVAPPGRLGRKVQRGMVCFSRSPVLARVSKPAVPQTHVHTALDVQSVLRKPGWWCLQPKNKHSIPLAGRGWDLMYLNCTDYFHSLVSEVLKAEICFSALCMYLF